MDTLKEAAKIDEMGYLWEIGIEGEGDQRAVFFTIDLVEPFDFLKLWMFTTSLKIKAKATEKKKKKEGTKR